MAMVLQPSRVRLTQAIYFGKPAGFGVTSIAGGNGITATPNPIITTGSLALGSLSSDWNAGNFNINAQNTTRIFNVRAYGALGNSVADDAPAIQAAVTAAQAVKGVVYFPRSAGYYRVKTTISVQDATGLSIVGEGTVGSQIAADVTTPGITVLDIFSNIGSGSVRDIVIKDIGITSGAAGLALRIWNCLHFTLENVYLAGGSPALSIQGSGNGTLINVQSYGGVNMGDGGGLLTNVGPLTSLGCQFGAGALATALVIKGDALALTFNTCQLQNNGGAYAATTIIDGGGLGVGSAEFFNCHGESNFNPTNTGFDFMIGNTTKFGRVGFYGGNFWGHGDTVNYQAAWLKIVRCTNVVVEGVTVSKLGNVNGYNTGMIVTSATFPAAGDTYRFASNNKDDIAGPLYVDATLGLVTGDVQNTNGAITGNLAVGTPASAIQPPPWPVSIQAQQAMGWHWAPGQAASRNWGFRTDTNAFGDFTILTSSVQTLGLLDFARLQISPTGNVGIGLTAPTRTLDFAGTQRYRGIAAPPVSEVNSGTIYFDSGTNRLMASLNGSAYVPVIGSGGLTGSGTTGQVAYWDSVTSLASPSGIYIDAINNFIGIAKALPAYSLDVGADINVDGPGIYRYSGQVALAMDTINGSVFVACGGGPFPLVGFGSTLVGYTSGIAATGTGITAVGSQVLANSSGSANTGVGNGTLFATTSGQNNTAIGASAGITNTTGGGNILIGSGADVLAGNLTDAAAIGTGAQIGQSASLNIGGGITRVGIFTPTPKQTLDVTGSVGMHQGIVTLVNGLNSDITLATDNSWIRIEGPTGAFSIGGFITPFNVSDGLILAVYNTVAQQMTIVNEDLASTAINRIKTLTGGDVVLRAGTSAATFRYDAFDDRFILMNSN